MTKRKRESAAELVQFVLTTVFVLLCLWVLDMTDKSFSGCPPPVWIFASPFMLVTFVLQLGTFLLFSKKTTAGGAPLLISVAMLLVTVVALQFIGPPRKVCGPDHAQWQARPSRIAA